MKFILDLYFKLFRVVFNKLPIFTNKTGKSNWDWLKLDKNNTFTKVLGALFFWGCWGFYLIIINYLINSYYILNYLSQNNFDNALNKIAQIKLFYNYVVGVYFATWFFTMIIIVKNHNKKPNIKKIF